MLNSQSGPTFLSRVILWDVLLLVFLSLTRRSEMFLAIGALQLIGTFRAESVRWSKDGGELPYGRLFLAASALIWLCLGIALTEVPKLFLLSPVCRFVKC